MKKILVLGAALVAFALVGCDAAKEAGDAYQDAKSTIQAVVDSDMTPESVKKVRWAMLATLSVKSRSM